MRLAKAGSSKKAHMHMFGSQMRLHEKGNMGKYSKLEMAFIVANAEVGVK